MKRIVLLFVAGALLFSCATGGGQVQQQGRNDEVVFSGNGEGASLGAAMNSAKIDAIRRGVESIIGSAAAAANADELERQIYGTRNPNVYIRNDQMEILRKDNMGSVREPRIVMDIEVPVRLDVLRQTLDSLGIGGAPSRSAAGTNSGSGRQDTQGSGNQEDQQQVQRQDYTFTDDDLYEGATEDQARFLYRYLQNMTYMVYFAEDAQADSMFLNQGVTQANGYLAEAGYTLIDSAQIQRLQEDREMVAEAETMRSMSLVQWIAQSLNADVYLEIDMEVEGSSDGGRHYGVANITIKIFDASTAQLLGSVPYRSDRSFSRTSQRDAMSNAVQSAVYAAMPVAVEQSQNLLSRAFNRGIRYEMTLLNTSDSRLMSDIRRRLRREVSEVETISQTADETRYAVYFFGRLTDLEDIMYDLSDRVAGMENLWLVMSRGKSITFDLGL